MLGESFELISIIVIPPLLMEKSYSLLIFLFVSVVVISLAGFYTTYLSFIPDMSRFDWLIHLHFLAFTGWFTLIVIQPILIWRRNYALHRKLGRASYFLAPVLVITILLLVKIKVQRELPVSPGEASVTALIGLLDAISFSIYYIIAMVNQRNVRWHVAFIIAATLIVLNPGMSRLLNYFSPGLGLMAAVIVPFVVPLVIIVFEKIRHKRAVLMSPYLVFFLCWLLEIVIFMSVPETEWWRGLVEKVWG